MVPHTNHPRVAKGPVKQRLGVKVKQQLRDCMSLLTDIRLMVKLDTQRTSVRRICSENWIFCL